MSTTVARAAHPYALAASSPHVASTSRASRRASYQLPPPLPLGATNLVNMPLPPTPTSSSHPAAAALPPPAYARHDKPGAETRFTRVDRTANWVQQQVEPPASQEPASLQAFGYFGGMGTEPPSYNNNTTSPTQDIRRGSRSNGEDEVVGGIMGRALARHLADEDKMHKSAASANRSKSATATKAKSVLRMLVGKPGDAAEQQPYARLGDAPSSSSASRY